MGAYTTTGGDTVYGYEYHPCPDMIMFTFTDDASRWPHRLGDVDETDGRFKPDSKANGARLRLWRAAYASAFRFGHR